jgi:hypothetical protein
MVTLTSITTKVSDASRTIIYSANSPTIYACVNELEFHCIYCQPMLLVEFPLYILNHAKHARQRLRNKTKEAQFPSNPRNFSPIGIHCQNGPKGLEGQYIESSSSRCAWPKKSENTFTNPKTIIWRKSNYIEDQILQKNRMTWWLNFQQEKIAIKRSK